MKSNRLNENEYGGSKEAWRIKEDKRVTARGIALLKSLEETEQIGLRFSMTSLRVQPGSAGAHRNATAGLLAYQRLGLSLGGDGGVVVRPGGLRLYVGHQSQIGEKHLVAGLRVRVTVQ